MTDPTPQTQSREPCPVEKLQSGYTFRELIRAHREWLMAIGSKVRGHSPLESVALIASGVGDAAKECRGQKPTERFGEELAGIILCVLETARCSGINIEAEVLAKIQTPYEWIIEGE